MLDVTPKCTLLSAGSFSYRNYLSEFEAHVGGSDVWDVKQSTDNGAGNDYGITLTPTDPNQTFDTNVRYDSTSGDVFVAVDPNGEITDALDPTGTGSAETSPEGWRALFHEDTLNSELLVLEWGDAWGWLLKDAASNSYIPRWLQVGKVINRPFANDPQIGRQPLAWIGGRPNQLDRAFGYDPHNNNVANEAKIPGGWASMYSKNDSGNRGPTAYPAPNTIPSPYVLFDDDLQNADDRVAGFTKYVYRWHFSDGSDGLQMIEPSPGDGFIFVSYNGGDHYLIVPWDTSVNPV